MFRKDMEPDNQVLIRTQFSGLVLSILPIVHYGLPKKITVGHFLVEGPAYPYGRRKYPPEEIHVYLCV